MPYQHGVRVLEQATGVTAPITGTAGLQVVFGTAPVNLAKNPTGVTNKPIIAYTWQEAVDQLGYSDDWNSYTLCQAMYASFKLFGVAPVIFVNVSFKRSSLRAVAITVAPISEHFTAICRPMLEDAPVTRIVLSSNENGFFILLFFLQDYLEQMYQV